MRQQMLTSLGARPAPMIAQSESDGGRSAAQRSLGRGSLTVARRRRRTAVMKYIRRSRAVINVAKSPSRLRRTLDARAPVDDVLSSYIGIILPRAAAAAAPLASALYTASC